MSSTFEQIANIIAETCDIARPIKSLPPTIRDRQPDLASPRADKLGIRCRHRPEVNDGKATTEQYFVLKNLADRIDELVAAKNAGGGAAS